MFYASLPLIFLFAGASICLPETMPESSQHSREQANLQQSSALLEKRSPHYDFGLGKRAYTYVSEYKRLPVYNFGLGKRSRPYSFGLGKRSVEESEQPDDEMMMDDAPDYQDSLDELLEHYDIDDAGNEKRGRPYSFGLGKRYYVDDQNKRAGRYGFALGKRLPHYNFGLGKRAPYDFGLGKRAPYDFGLGKRAPYDFGLGKRAPYDFGLGKRAPYDFGLGKRFNKFNFGLGKRVTDLHRFNFGLGKRSDNIENDEGNDEP